MTTVHWFAGNLPFPEVLDKENSESSIRQFEFQFNDIHLRKLMLVSWKRGVFPECC